MREHVAYHHGHEPQSADFQFALGVQPPTPSSITIPGQKMYYIQTNELRSIVGAAEHVYYYSTCPWCPCKENSPATATDVLRLHLSIPHMHEDHYDEYKAELASYRTARDRAPADG